MRHAHVTGISIGMEALADVPLEKFRQQLEVNVVGQVSVTQVRVADKLGCGITVTQVLVVRMGGSLCNTSRWASIVCDGAQYVVLTST